MGKEDKSHLKLDREDQVISTQVILTHALFGSGKHRHIAQKGNAHHSFMCQQTKGECIHRSHLMIGAWSAGLSVIQTLRSKLLPQFLTWYT